MTAKVVSNLEGLASIIGTFQGISEAAQDEKFIQQILLDANKRTLEKFNVMAAERSRRTRNLNRNFNHMYEFGVSGITPGRVVFTDATSPAARLWVFKSLPVGKSVDTFVTFRDAIVPNPKPAERPDLKGVSADIISRMSKREYVFRKRASMVEYGKDVSISPYRAKALIFPSRESEIGVGFWPRSAGPMRVSLDGQTAHGRSKHKLAFTNYFLAWWNTAGESEVRTSAHNSIAARIGAARRKAAKQTNVLKPARATDTKAAGVRASREAKAEMMRGQGL